MKSQKQKDVLNVKEIYPTFQGEQNAWGIGAPVIFVRLQGCKIRCYKKTLGTLCDTPEALGFIGGTPMTPFDIICRLREMRRDSGINLICLSGGDPLHHDLGSIEHLLRLLNANEFDVSVETSGIDTDVAALKNSKQYVGDIGESNYFAFPKAISFVIDFKVKSAGIPKANERNILLNPLQLRELGESDYIKFVLYDTNDFNEMLNALKVFELHKCAANIVAGCFWQSPYMDDIMLFNLLREAKVLDRVQMNFQVHKMSLLVKECTESLTTFNFDNVQI